jgi:hypothetical protein
MSRLIPNPFGRVSPFSERFSEEHNQMMQECEWVSRYKGPLEGMLHDEYPRSGGETVVRTFDVQILSSTPLPGGSNQWEYDAWIEVELDTDTITGWSVKPNGLSGSGTGKRIRNKAEVGNDGQDMEMCGWDVSLFPQGGTFALGPIPDGRITTCEIRVALDTGEPSYWVDIQNMPNGECPP